MSDANVIQERLRLLRSRTGKNQDSVAEACGISRIALARYEGGQRIPKAEILAKLAEYYGVSTDYLMGREKPPKEASSPRDEGRAKMEEILRRMPQDKYDQALAILEVLAAEQKKEG